MACNLCRGQGWVCENHLDVPWDDDDKTCCGGAGTNCVCNPSGELPEGFKTYVATEPNNIKEWVQ